MKTQIANLTGADVGQIRLFKFVYVQLNDDDLVGDIAQTNGATYISAFTEFSTLNTTAAHLLFEEQGPPPVIPPDPIRQQQQRQEAQQQQRNHYPAEYAEEEESWD